LAPISYGPLQFRMSEALKPIALFSPVYAGAFALGNFLANLASPFGFWDFGVMALVDGLAAWLCWFVGRRTEMGGVILQAVVISIGVSVFPLWLGGRMPIVVTLPFVLLSELLILPVAYRVIWRREDLRQLLRWS
jgi:uncharacterized membrane protein